MCTFGCAHMSTGTERGQEKTVWMRWSCRHRWLWATWCSCGNWIQALCESSTHSSWPSHLSNPVISKFNRHCIKPGHTKEYRTFKYYLPGPPVNSKHEETRCEPMLLPIFYSRSKLLKSHLWGPLFRNSAGSGHETYCPRFTSHSWV